MNLHAYAKVEEHDTIVETIVTAGYEKQPIVQAQVIATKSEMAVS